MTFIEEVYYELEEKYPESLINYVWNNFFQILATAIKSNLSHSYSISPFGIFYYSFTKLHSFVKSGKADEQALIKYELSKQNKRDWHKKSMVTGLVGRLKIRNALTIKNGNVNE